MPQKLTKNRGDWTFLEASNAFFLGEVVPFPKLIHSFGRITAFVKHFPENELGFLVHEMSRSYEGMMDPK